MFCGALCAPSVIPIMTRGGMSRTLVQRLVELRPEGIGQAPGGASSSDSSGGQGLGLLFPAHTHPRPSHEHHPQGPIPLGPVTRPTRRGLVLPPIGFAPRRLRNNMVQRRRIGSTVHTRVGPVHPVPIDSARTQARNGNPHIPINAGMETHSGIQPEVIPELAPDLHPPGGSLDGPDHGRPHRPHQL